MIQCAAAAVVAAHEQAEEVTIRHDRPGQPTEQLAYYSQSPGGSSGTITLPGPQGWTQADLEHATALGQ